MASKTANVNIRIEHGIKEKAEKILEKLGIPRAVAIDMYYRQIIAHNGIPFSISLPARDEMTKDQFDSLMEEGLKQAKSDNSFDLDEVFNELEE
ncbi:MAG: type II toxin-antitoxin system RelB/DinJ family antitoxin [Parasporobacterium sp.]|nr:type II toxin-antitoxin system RelB/DinJ family antitoxin [Parasporobacterium sp.]